MDVYIQISQFIKPHRKIRCLIPLTLWNKSGFIIQGAPNLWLKPSSNSCSSRQIAKDPLLQHDPVKKSLSGYICLKKSISLTIQLMHYLDQSCLFQWNRMWIERILLFLLKDLAETFFQYLYLKLLSNPFSNCLIASVSMFHQMHHNFLI